MNKISENSICEKWAINKNINPQTMRKIKENGPVYKKLAKKCSLNQKKESNTKKINAFMKINKLFIPYINRNSVNIIDRINYFLIIKKFLLTIKDVNNCLRLYNIDPINKLPIYRIGKNIILDKNIGQPSANGIVFLSHFKSNIKYGTKFDKLNKFTVKITNQSKNHKKEIEILKKITREVIELKCPHFPISYGYLRCDNTTLKSNNSDDYSIIKDKHLDSNLLPEIINKNNKIYIQINELASGDFLNILITTKHNLLNNIVQMFISIMFFHNATNYYHYDSHPGNFLYHKIKPGGYFHYNIYGKDFYLENIGYLWMIWDFGLVKSFKEAKKEKISINYDYYKYINDLDKIIKAIKFKKLTPLEKSIKTKLLTLIEKYNNVIDYKKIKNMNQKILTFFNHNISSFITTKPINIINKIPYVIN
jgi:hypothetical protein